MAESFTSYSIENDQKFKTMLKNASDVSTDLRVPFGLILMDFYKSERAIFQLKGPGQYPDFKNGGARSKYAEMKQKKVGFKYPLLYSSGSLAASLTGPNNKGSISFIGKASMYFGTSIPYAIYHQSDKVRSKIPLRKFLFIGPEAKQFATNEQMGRLQRWLAILNDHIAKKLEEYRF
jgi:phage gpG-like protein